MTGSAPPPPPRRSGAVAFGIVAAFLALSCLMLVPITGIVAAIAIPNFMAMQMKAKRAEVPANVDAIKTTELAYDAAFDGFVPCGSRGDAESMVGKNQHDWFDDPAAPCFEQLGWQPDGKVRGSYWVTVDAAHHEFTVYGVSDVDGDGQVAEYRASLTRNAERVTDEHAY